MKTYVYLVLLMLPFSTMQGFTIGCIGSVEADQLKGRLTSRSGATDKNPTRVHFSECGNHMRVKPLRYAFDTGKAEHWVIIDKNTINGIELPETKVRVASAVLPLPKGISTIEELNNNSDIFMRVGLKEIEGGSFSYDVAFLSSKEFDEEYKRATEQEALQLKHRQLVQMKKRLTQLQEQKAATENEIAMLQSSIQAIADQLGFE